MPFLSEKFDQAVGKNGCVATFKKKQDSDGSGRPGAGSCSHLEQLVDQRNLSPNIRTVHPPRVAEGKTGRTPAGLSERFSEPFSFATYARYRIRDGIRHTETLAGRHHRPHVSNERLRYMRIGYARVSKADGSQSPDLQC